MKPHSIATEICGNVEAVQVSVAGWIHDNDDRGRAHIGKLHLQHCGGLSGGYRLNTCWSVRELWGRGRGGRGREGEGGEGEGGGGRGGGEGGGEGEGGRGREGVGEGEGGRRREGEGGRGREGVGEGEGGRRREGTVVGGVG